MSSSASSSTSYPLASRKVWVGNLDPRVTEYQLLKLAEPFGAIEKLDFVYGLDHSGANRVPRGFAFVAYKTPESALKAIRQLDGVKLLNRPLRVKPAKSAGGEKRPLKDNDDKERDAKMAKMAKEDKIKAMEAKLKAMQEGDDQDSSFKLAVQKTKEMKK